MPNMSGARLAEHLRKMHTDMKTLYMLGFPDMEEGSEALRSTAQLHSEAVEPRGIAASSA